MKKRVIFYCKMPIRVVLMAGIGLMTVTVSAYGETKVTAHTSTHHTHHRGKTRHHDRHAKHAAAKKDVSQTHQSHTSHHKKHAVAAKAATATAGGSAAVAAAHTQDNAPPPPVDNKGTETGLPLPRFAALRADRVYMRRGPGERYPIDWVYHRRGYPVKIEREFGVWRLVEDPDGQKGWVHQVTLRGGRSFVIPGSSSSEGDDTRLPTAQHADPRIVAYRPEQDVLRGQNHDVLLMSSQEADRKVIAVLEPGTVGAIKACPQGSSWCHVTVRGYDGWLERQSLWGVQPGEIIQPD